MLFRSALNRQVLVRWLRWCDAYIKLSPLVLQPCLSFCLSALVFDNARFRRVIAERTDDILPMHRATASTSTRSRPRIGISLPHVINGTRMNSNETPNPRMDSMRQLAGWPVYLTGCHVSDLLPLFNFAWSSSYLSPLSTLMPSHFHYS